ncbi:MAG TPA: RT0821/Lpp0805 family surface protein [Stellaceae bacterium]|nr:RT0821/Lpp0805 family surface protein [Stellaceae bacterium]
MRALSRIIIRLLLLAPLAATALLLRSPEGAAQYSKALRSFPKLTNTDIAIIRKAVREDLTGKPKGTTLPWSNPESRNAGTVTLLDRFDSAGRDCRRVRYVITPGSKQPAEVIGGSYVLTSCRLGDGSWKIDNAARPDKPG